MDHKSLPARFAPRRRHRKKLRDNIMGITRPAIRRLARRGGVIRIKMEVYQEVRVVIRDRIAKVLEQVVHVLDSATTHRYERKVVTTRDVVYALHRLGNTIYGFD